MELFVVSGLLWPKKDDSDWHDFEHFTVSLYQLLK